MVQTGTGISKQHSHHLSTACGAAAPQQTHRALRRLLALALLLLAATTAMAQQYYVFSFTSGNTTYYLAPNDAGTEIDDNKTNFDYSCVWSLNSGQLQNVKTGLYFDMFTDSPYNRLQETAPSKTFSIYDDKLTYQSNPYRYYLLFYDGGWDCARSGYSSYRAAASGVDEITVQAGVVVNIIPAVGEDGVIAIGETTADYAASQATYTPAYTGYAYDGITVSPSNVATTTVVMNQSGSQWIWNTSNSGASVSNGVVTLTDRAAVGSGITFTAQVIYNNCTSAVASQTVAVRSTIDAPAIAFNDRTSTGATATLTAVTGATIYYTLDGTDPTTSSNLYNASFSVTAGQEVRAIAVLTLDGTTYSSSIATKTYTPTSGIEGNVVVLYDYEDHNWSYYSGDPNPCDPTEYRNPIRSLNPCNVKIIYKGGSVSGASAVAVSATENQNEFHYYETLEKSGTNYPYTTIPNPFSKRPRLTSATGTTDGFYGFNGWKVNSITGGSITGYSAGSTIPAETAITFVPTTTPSVNGTDIVVELEAQWATAYVKECAANSLSTSGLTGGSYERNFIVITSGDSIGTEPSVPVTISAQYPDGTSAQGSTYISGDFTCDADTKFEYIRINASSNTYTANNHDLILGRGISNNGSVCVDMIQGISENKSDLNYTIRLESGIYTGLAFVRDDVTTYVSGTNQVRGILGSDYDRVIMNDNSLEVKITFKMADNVYYIGNNVNHLFDVTIKSGKFQTDCSDQRYENGTESNPANASGDSSFYVSIGDVYTTPGKRRLTILGGVLASIAGGIDSSDYTKSSDTSFYLRMKGGTIRGSIYGAGAYANATGVRKYVITGGEVRGWIGAGCNGTNNSWPGGTLNGNTFVYIGGDVVVGKTQGNQYYINASQGGNVFGAGSGNSNYTTTGRVNNSFVVIADAAHVMGNVYAGGNMGFARYTGSLYVLGGTIEGSAFGGSNKKQGTNTIVNMYGGTVKGGVYGGSNLTGTISENTVVNVSGGTVEGSVFGGGLGVRTRVLGNVDVTIGYANCTENAPELKINTNVYGGSQQGVVNSDDDYSTSNRDTVWDMGTDYKSTKHTNVMVNNGHVVGSVYGGGFGEGDAAANVAGVVNVTVTGGRIENDVFGCNNQAGSPAGVVNVTIEGGSMDNVYGGGNEAAYGDGNLSGGNKEAPHVLMTGGEVRSSVYGGGKGANATISEHTDVRVRGTAVVGKNVYGGGNAAAVTGSTHVEIGGQDQTAQQ